MDQMAKDRALRGEWLTIDDAVRATIALGLEHIGFRAFETGVLPMVFRGKPMRLRKQYRDQAFAARS